MNKNRKYEELIKKIDSLQKAILSTANDIHLSSELKKAQLALKELMIEIKQPKN